MYHTVYMLHDKIIVSVIFSLLKEIITGQYVWKFTYGTLI